VAGALREAGRQAEAVELYRSVAVAYRDQGRSQQAIAVCRSILEIAPDDERCHALLASLVAQHKGRVARDTGQQVYGDEVVLEVGTPPPPVAAGTSPGRTSPPPRRSSLDETPLPQPMPYHVADPTTKNLQKLSEADLLPTPDPDDDVSTRPGDATPSAGKGLANAARRISSALIGARGSEHPSEDLSLELDTRQRPRIESAELAKIAPPPPTAPVERLDLDDDDDGVPTLSDEDADEPTRPREMPLDIMIRTQAEGPIGSAFFQPLPADRRAAVLARFHKRTVAKGATVIRHGEVGHALIVVARGALDVRVGAVAIGVVGTGEYVGEGSLLARAPSPVHVVAQTDCELLLLQPRDFYEIAGAFPALWAELKEVAERRKREREAILRRASP
jgi:hypothetical protein